MVVETQGALGSFETVRQETFDPLVQLLVVGMPAFFSPRTIISDRAIGLRGVVERNLAALLPVHPHEFLRRRGRDDRHKYRCTNGELGQDTLYIHRNQFGPTRCVLAWVAAIAHTGNVSWLHDVSYRCGVQAN